MFVIRHSSFVITLMSEKIIRFSVTPPDAAHPDVALWLAVLADARSRLMWALDGLTVEELDAPPIMGRNTIGTILYHTALADLDWIYTNMLTEPFPADVINLFPHHMVDGGNNLTQATGWDLDAYVLRLNTARQKVIEHYSTMDITTFRQLLRRDLDFGTVEMTPEAVICHLAQHEAEHRGEIQMLRGRGPG